MPGLPSFVFVCPSNCGLLQLDRDHGSQPLADVLAVEALLLLQELELAGLRVQRAGQRAAEAGEVRAALDRVDVVGEGEDGLLVRGVPLHRHFDGALVGVALEIDDVLVDRVLRLVDVRDEVADAALVVELDGLAVRALVDELDVEALGEERGLAQALGDRRRVDVELLEDLGVGQEGDRRPDGVVLGHLPDDLHVAGGLAALELLPVDLAVAAHLGHEPLGQRVHDRDADTMQAARDLVAVAAELSAGMELGEDDRQRRQSLVRHHVDGDAGAPVLDRDRIVRMEGDLDPVVASLERLVDRVVDDLVDEVMEPAKARRADVHARPKPDRLESFEDGDVPSGVVRFSHEKSPANSAFAGTGKCIRRGGRPGFERAPLLWLSRQIRAGLDPQFRR